MVIVLSIWNAFLYDFKVNLKIYFDNSIDIETIDYNILNKYMIHKFNQYAATNAEDYTI